ncbi:thiamine pyrophosphate-binding protein [Hydrogenophaga sp.]|uniref:thiamine pyrophosphate-binding protein n=1 Tax=Hydrogenophaga sp. TaxID=1904254 RepID=UPI002718A743|nr:thiamine pyrophosphate-binding protein [Hydrogenophaga sp.]MDO9436704.1 thiamine pyrophosphate-binding protein [Hydrogenophaga sp.]
MKVSHAIAEALALESDGILFGLMGDANMAVWDALLTQARARIVWSRHDGAAILMADGYAQASGKLGIATVTSGPGLASAANALISAARAGSPLVVFTGEYPNDGKTSVQGLDTRRFAAACECEFRSLASLDTLAEDVAEGFYTARTQQRPVIISLPYAHWDAELPWDWDYRVSTDFVPRRDMAAPAEAMAELADKLATAERPVILAGRGAQHADARAALVALGDHVGALFATSLVAKGFFDGHAHDLGISGSFSSVPTEALMAEADFVLAVGASLNSFTSEGGLLFPRAEVARIDVKPHAPSIGLVPGLYVKGDARRTCEALLTMMQTRGGPRAGFRNTDTQQRLATPVPLPARATDGLDPRVLMQALSKALPDRAQVVSGAGHFWSWPVAHLALPPGGRFQHSASFGSIGLGLGHAIGAAMADPTRLTVLIEGDGSLLQAVQELHAAVEQKVRVAVVVMNDAAYGAEVMKMQWKGRNHRDAQWTSPDFVALARGFGCDGTVLEREDDIGAAIARAATCEGPFVIDARISPTLVSDAYSRLFLAQENRIPLLRPVRAARSA